MSLKHSNLYGAILLYWLFSILLYVVLMYGWESMVEWGRGLVLAALGG